MIARSDLGPVLVAAMAAGCHMVVPPEEVAEPADTWGPLAVVEDSGGMEALATGIVRIDRDCVYLDTPPRDLVLVWDADRTRWEPPGGILFETFGGEVVAIQNGQRLAFGGGDGNSSFEWVNAPDPGCPSDKWLISDVAPPD